MYYDSTDFIELFVDMILLFLFVFATIFVIRRIANRDKTPTSNTSAQTAADKQRLVEDIRMTQTSSTTDAVQVLDNLGETSPGYRHYCELVGTSQTSGGIVAPYSKREVAYYDLRCYRIESREGRDVETLIAHEKSIEPFYLTDTSGDQRIYIDVDSFGNNCILINSTNRVEGPNSDVTQALNSAMQKHGAGSSPRVSFSAQALDVARAGANWLEGAIEWTRRGIAQAIYAANLAAGRLADFAAGPQPALALVGADEAAGTQAAEKGTALFAKPGPNQRGRANVNISIGGNPFGDGPFGGSFPPGLNDFFGGNIVGGSLGGHGYGGPYVWGGGRQGSSVAETLLSVGLGMLLSGINTTQQTQHTTVTQPPRDSFRGYRIIEDVVPLGCPIYGLGEIYRNGADVHIGKSVSDTYPSSYFACKQEAEVIAHLSK